jgi:hypothetical protein
LPGLENPNVQAGANCRGHTLAEESRHTLGDLIRCLEGRRIDALGQDRTRDETVAIPPNEVNVANAKAQTGKKPRGNRRRDTLPTAILQRQADEQEQKRPPGPLRAFSLKAKEVPKSLFAVRLMWAIADFWSGRPGIGRVAEVCAREFPVESRHHECCSQSAVLSNSHGHNVPLKFSADPVQCKSTAHGVK